MQIKSKRNCLKYTKGSFLHIKGARGLEEESHKMQVLVLFLWIQSTNASTYRLNKPELSLISSGGIGSWMLSYIALLKQRPSSKSEQKVCGMLHESNGIPSVIFIEYKVKSIVSHFLTGALRGLPKRGHPFCSSY